LRTFFIGHLRREGYFIHRHSRPISYYKEVLLKISEANGLDFPGKNLFYLAALLYKRETVKSLELLKPQELSERRKVGNRYLGHHENPNF